MAEVHFWTVDWEHECCGPDRRVGDIVTVNLVFEGEVERTAEADRVESRYSGDMVLVSEAHDARESQPGSVVRLGDLAFGVAGKDRDGRIRCTGQLWEDRHGGVGPWAETTGRVTGIRWRPARYELTAEGSRARVGYDEGRVIYNTVKRPRRERRRRPRQIPAETSPPGTGHGKRSATGSAGWVAYRPAAEQPEPSGWAFVFTLDVAVDPT